MIKVQIVKTKSETTLKNFYSQNVGSFMKSAQYNNQPILSTDYQKFKSMSSKKDNPTNEEADDAEVALEMQEEDNPLNQMNPLFRILHFMGIYLMIVLVLQHGKMYQIAIIITVVILFYAIEVYRKYNIRRMLK